MSAPPVPLTRRPKRRLATWATVVACTVAWASPVVPAAADPGGARGDGGVTTSARGDRIEADIFRVSPDGRRVGDLASYCRDAHAALDNARAVEEGTAEEDDQAGSAPDEDGAALPHAGVEQGAEADISPCRGTSVRIASDPPGDRCEYGEVRAVTGYFYYDPAAASFRFLSTEDYEAYRREGGDAGRWPAEYVCLDVFSGVEDHASFREVLDEPVLWKSPDPVGLTGVDTWVWFDFSAPESHTLSRTFTVDAGGLPLGMEATVWVDEVRWDMDGDGTWDARLDPPDTAGRPATRFEYRSAGGRGEEEGRAAVHVYEVKGVHEVTVEVRWRGTYALVGYPGNGGTYQPLTTSSVTAYQVCEVVTRRTDPGARLDPADCAGG